MKKLYLPILLSAALLTSCDLSSQDVYTTEIYLGNGIRWKCKNSFITDIKTPHFECSGKLKVCEMGDVSSLFNLIFLQHVGQTIVAECDDGTFHYNVTDFETKTKK